MSENKIEDGGPAFRSTIEVRTVNSQGDLVNTERYEVAGVSVRDYFAAKALPAVHDSVRDDIRPLVQSVMAAAKAAQGRALTSDEVTEIVESDEMKELEAKLLSRMASRSYEIADAMLRARKEAR